MPEKQFGVAVVWGISTTDYTKAGVAQKLNTEEQTYRKTADVEETRSDIGEYANICMYGGQEELTLRVYPSDFTIAGAKGANVLPLIGDVMKVIDPDDSNIGAPSAGKEYIVMECGKNRTGTTKVSFDVTLRRYGGITNYTPLT
jgi:hypothetical protein